MAEKSYEQLLREQIEQYRDTEVMHDLPPVFFLWIEDFLLPHMRQVFEAGDINAFYINAFLAASAGVQGVPSYLSLGCGDGAVEIEIARGLKARGVTDFRFFCFDLSDVLLDRFRAALPDDLREHFELVEGDLNAHAFDRRFDAIMANHSLHHIVDLEGIYRTAYEQLADTGVFVTSDMIGRNGHLRWPEAKLFVDFFWPFLKLPQRANVQLRRLETSFADHDCSGEGFEGVRAQEVLPLLLAQGFHPWKFLGTGGFVDVFVDRNFGPHFQMDDADDRFLARRIGQLNELMLDMGAVKPTMMLGYFTKQPRSPVFYRNRDALSAVRDPAVDPAWLAGGLRDMACGTPDPAYVFRAAGAGGVEEAQPAPELPAAVPADGPGGRGMLAPLLRLLGH